MRVETVGEGRPEYAVIGSIHGDEPCGKKAIEKILGQNFDFKKPVKFIIANEKALEENVRFTETDLNRSFPGDPKSKLYEERLAAEIMAEIKDTKVLDIHSTRSYPEPFGIIKDTSEETMELLKNANVSRAIYFSGSSGSTNSYSNGVTVEAGYQGSEKAVENAYNTIINFLAAEDVIEAEFKQSDPEIFEYYETVEGEGYEFTAENFQLVKKGEVFARKNGEELRAEEDFYPVLMSSKGYEHIIGFKSRKLDRQ